MKKVSKKILFYTFMIALAWLFLFPIVWMIVTSFKPEAMIFEHLKSFKAFLPPLEMSPKQWLEPYIETISKFGVMNGIKNSLLYGTLAVVFNVAVNSMAAYVLARFEFPLKKFWITLIILIMIIPAETGVVPLFVIVHKLGLVNSIPGLILPGLVSVFNIFLLRQFFLSIPKELEEAALIDGASRISIFYKIILPLSKPILATVSMLTFIGSWNDFLWPVIILGDNSKMPLQVLLTVISNIEDINTNIIMASLTISTIPIILIYVFFQKYIVEGISNTGIK